MNLTWEQTQDTTYTGLTQADWDAMPGPVESHTREPLTDAEIADLGRMLDD